MRARKAESWSSRSSVPVSARWNTARKAASEAARRGFNHDHHRNSHSQGQHACSRQSMQRSQVATRDLIVFTGQYPVTANFTLRGVRDNIARQRSTTTLKCLLCAMGLGPVLNAHKGRSKGPRVGDDNWRSPTYFLQLPRNLTRFYMDRARGIQKHLMHLDGVAHDNLLDIERCGCCGLKLSQPRSKFKNF